ncbi:efflux RND transporter periplasmic adaptor subunit [Nocardioides acrostichi]|uniref:HlyD family efflux transporter periplasmic adaptor subunit n=1 Tax=Nocardioides acrostichi TaxID=2784339 RepID=A0A930Y869_9ACTN|nr:biotin/lipoyl-binding protein [Nocardioides acrostichi]MBF4162802.1 HlyD family efflux transporter periplasmic adaptor subunit [Nocardioides acrostichi]
MRLRLPAHRRLTIGVLIVLLVALGGGTGAWLLTRGDSAVAASTTATVETQTLQTTVSADGTLEPTRTRDLDFDVSGTVTRVAVSEGDTVRKGQILAVVDDTALVATRRAAAASLAAARAQLAQDEDDDASDVQLASDSAAVVTARATLADAQDAVEEATLRATIGGLVTSVGVTKGEVVGSSSGSTGSSSDSTGSSSGSSSGSASTSTAAVEIVSAGSYVVDATVGATDVDSLHKGLQAQLTVSGVDDTVYGTVRSIGLVAQTSSSGAAVFPVTIAVTGRRKDLYAGTSVTASIIVEQRDDVLVVDSRALQTDDQGTYVTQVVDGRDVRTAVEVGETVGMATEITQGLQAGDVVRVTTGFGQRGSTGQSGGPEGGQQQMPGGEMGQSGQGMDGSGAQPPAGAGQ